jgi:hypothetical protein
MPFVIPILVFLVGLALVLSGLLRRPRGVIRIAVGASLVVGIGAIGARLTYIDAGLDLNPTVRRPQELAGTWQHGATEFALDSAGGWRCFTPRSDEPPCGRAAAGRWSTRDFEVQFVATNGDSTAALRIVTYRGAYRLIHPFDDPDDWSYSLDYERVAP